MTLLGRAVELIKMSERGDRAAKKIFELDSQHMHQNIYASAGRWKDQEVIRQEMKEKRINKIPGKCCVEVNDKT